MNDMKLSMVVKMHKFCLLIRKWWCFWFIYFFLSCAHFSPFSYRSMAVKYFFKRSMLFQFVTLLKSLPLLPLREIVSSLIQLYSFKICILIFNGIFFIHVTVCIWQHILWLNGKNKIHVKRKIQSIIRTCWHLRSGSEETQ